MASEQPAQDAEGREAASSQNGNSSMWLELGRAFAGALLFSISLLMTMETWWLGFYMARWQLAIFICVNMVLLVGLAYYRGFREDLNWRDATVDAFVGYAVGVVTGAFFLFLFGVITWDMPADEIVGKVALQTVSSSIGALLARGQFGGSEGMPEEEQGETTRYWAEIFLMIVGSLFVAYTVAPTDEIVLIAYRMTAWHALATVLLSLVILHTFVYYLEFRGQEQPPEGAGFWSVYVQFTVVGYMAVFLTSLYILWTFGRTHGVELSVIVMYGVVLSLPGSLGAAAARLIL